MMQRASYEAEALTGGDQQACLSYLMRIVKEVVESNSRRARQFGEGILQGNQLCGQELIDSIELSVL